MTMHVWRSAVLAAALLGAVPAAPQEAVPAAPQEAVPAAPQEAVPSAAQEDVGLRQGAQDALAAMDRSHDALSRRVEALSRRIDSFLGGKRAYEGSSGSYAQAAGSVILREGGDISFDHRVRAKLVLPNTKEKLKFLLESDPGEDLQDPLSPAAKKAGESPSLAKEKDDASKLFAGLQFALEKTNWHLTTDAGVRIKLPPDPFARVRVSRAVPLGDWVMRATETLFWFYSLGAGESSRIDFDRHLDSDTLFRSASEAVWKEEKGMFELSQGLSIFHVLNWRDVLVYKVGVAGQTDPNTHVSDWTAGIEYRRRIHKNWLFLTIEPALTFEKERNFKGEASFRVGLEAMFGEKYGGQVQTAADEITPGVPPGASAPVPDAHEEPVPE